MARWAASRLFSSTALKNSTSSWSPASPRARQGVHNLEYQNLENVAEDKVYKFAYILGVNKIRGAAAGTVLRPIGIV